MKVYLAAPYAARDLVREYADDLLAVGLVITSSWLSEEHDITPGTTGAATDLDAATVAQHVADDLAGVEVADLLVIFTEASVGVERSSGGRHVETGYALALGKRVLLVGEPENIFHRGLTRVADWHEALVVLAGWALAAERDRPREEVAR